jgi:hypothetical protein
LIRISSRRLRYFPRFISLALSLALLACPPAFADHIDKTLGDVLAAAESLFKAMQAKNYIGIWGLLSSASQETMIDDTYTAIAKEGGKEVPKEEIRRDFGEGGPIARGYWNGFLENFDPRLALEQSKWEKGTIGADRAEILIISKTAEKPALLKLFREKGGWKVGLVESFWGRK